MGKEKNNKQNPEEFSPQGYADALKAAMQAQKEAMKAAMQQAQSFQAQAMKEYGIDPETMQQAYKQNLDFANSMIQQAMENGFIPEDMTDEEYDLDTYSDFQIISKGDNKLSSDEKKFLAYGAPLFVLDQDNVDSLESNTDADMLKEMLEEWWEVTDKKTLFDNIEWLLNEGEHADADLALSEIRKRGLWNISEEEKEDEDSKIGDVVAIAEYMIFVNGLTEHALPETVLAWDLVRAVNLARWGFICGYINEDEMWTSIKETAQIAKGKFNSWDEYGKSFAVGRGVWQGDSDDYEIANESVTTLLEDETSPWKVIKW